MIIIRANLGTTKVGVNVNLNIDKAWELSGMQSILEIVKELGVNDVLVIVTDFVFYSIT